MRVLPGILLVYFAWAAPGWSQTTLPYGELPRTSPGSPVEEVLVTGEHPGPGLWKVSRGDHVLWILGTHSPLPKELVWRSQQVELVMTESQEVLGNYSATFTMEDGDVLEAKGKSLRSLLPRKTYSQWLALKKKYLGRNAQVEKALPVTAALLLRSSAFDRAGLTNADQVWRQINSLADAYHVPVTTAHQVNKVIRGGIPRDAKSQRIGVEYLIDTIANLEPELRVARVRANAWAVGDIDALKKQMDADQNAAHLYASSWPFFQGDELQSLIAETDRRWIEAAESALSRNHTTFAALPVFLLLRADGLLATLSAQGFVIEAPAE
jgi:uncharacterized protein YbaP (TraB family)